MGLTYSSVVDAAVDEVFSWHTRPGAITRLTPPWQPVRVLRSPLLPWRHTHQFGPVGEGATLLPTRRRAELAARPAANPDPEQPRIRSHRPYREEPQAWREARD